MKGLIKAIVAKFDSVISIVALSALVILFALAVPKFFISTTGRNFTGIWAVLVIALFGVHTARWSEKNTVRMFLPSWIRESRKDS